ncbi:MAG: hypothetical protein C4302_03820 [Thermus sp.]
MQVQTLRSWAESMARWYAQEIPDYNRLDERVLYRDVAMVSYEYLRHLEEWGNLDEMAFTVGQRRREQGVGLYALLRAYRLWAQGALEFLAREWPEALPTLAPKVATLLDRVCEQSARGYQEAPAPFALEGPYLVVGARPEETGALVVLPNAISLRLWARNTAYMYPPQGRYLVLDRPDLGVKGVLSEYALEQRAVLWVSPVGKELKPLLDDMEEALALAHHLPLAPGLYETRMTWALAIALEAPRGQARLQRILDPLHAFSDLVPTLEAYLASGGSLKQTADRLGVHPNTVLYRLHRVEELTGLNLSSTHDRLLLYMAIFLLRFQKAHEGPKASP